MTPSIRAKGRPKEEEELRATRAHWIVGRAADWDIRIACARQPRGAEPVHQGLGAQCARDMGTRPRHAHRSEEAGTIRRKARERAAKAKEDRTTSTTPRARAKEEDCIHLGSNGRIQPGSSLNTDLSTGNHKIRPGIQPDKREHRLGFSPNNRRACIPYRRLE